MSNPSADRGDRPRPRKAVSGRPARSNSAAGDISRLVETVLAATAPVVLIDALPGTGKSTLLRALSERTGVPVSRSRCDYTARDRGGGDPPLQLIDLSPDAELEIDPIGPRLIVAAAARQIVDIPRLRLYGQMTEFDNRDLFLDAQADPAYDDSAGWPALATHFVADPQGHAAAIAFLRETVLPRLSGPRLRVLQALDQSRRGLPDRGLGSEDRAALRWLRPLTSLGGEDRWRLRTEGFARILREALLGRPLSAEVGLLLEHAGDTTAAVVGTLAAGHRRRAVEIVGRAGGVMMGHLQGPEEARAVLSAFGDDPHPTIVALRIMTAMKAGHSGHAANLLDAAIRALSRRHEHAAAGMSQHERAMTLARGHGLPPDLRLIRLLMGIYSDRPLDAAFQSEFASLLAEVAPENHLLRGAVYNVALDQQIRSGRQGEAQATARRALDHYRAARAPYLAFYIHVHLALMHLVAGATELAATELDHAAGELAATPFEAPQDARFLRLLHAQVDYEQGRPEPMAEFAESALDDFAYGELWPSIAAQALAFGAEALQLLRGSEAALQYLEGWRVQMWRTRRFRLLIEQREVLILQSARRWREARLKLESMATRIGRNWIESAGENLADLRDPEDISQALIWLRQITLERPRARALGERLAQAAGNPNLSWRQRRCLEIWQAWAARRSGRVAPARRLLANTLGTCEARGCRAPVIEERQLVIPLLDDPRMLGGPIADAPVPRALRRGVTAEGGGPLSRQEWRALLLLAEGCGNKVIAREMAISLPTVKFHLKNLYAKLGVHDRRAAVTVARQRRILES